MISKFFRQLSPSLSLLLPILFLLSGCTGEAQLKGYDIFFRWEGSSPEQMESKVAEPLEKALAGLPGLQHIYSAIQGSTGQIRIWVDWEDVPPSADLKRITDQLQKAMPDLPAEIDPPKVSSDPVLSGSLIATFDFTRTRDRENFFLIRDLRENLAVIPGVELSGFAEVSATLKIVADPERMRAYNISPQEVMDSISMAIGGKMIANIQDFEALVVTMSGEGPVRLSDLAILEMDRSAGISGLKVFALPDAQKQEVYKEVEAAWEKYAASHSFQPWETVFQPQFGGKLIRVEVSAGTEGVELEEAGVAMIREIKEEIDNSGIPVEFSHTLKPSREARIRLDRERMKSLGIPVAAVAQQLFPATGRTLGAFEFEGANTEVRWVPYREVRDLMNFSIDFRDGEGITQKIPLSAIASIEMKETFPVRRIDQKRSLGLYFSPTAGEKSEIERWVSGLIQRLSDKYQVTTRVANPEIFYPDFQGPGNEPFYSLQFSGN